jgi:hypothetical protein
MSPDMQAGAIHAHGIMGGNSNILQKLKRFYIINICIYNYAYLHLEPPMTPLSKSFPNLNIK